MEETGLPFDIVNKNMKYFSGKEVNLLKKKTITHERKKVVLYELNRAFDESLERKLISQSRFDSLEKIRNDYVKKRGLKAKNK